MIAKINFARVRLMGYHIRITTLLNPVVTGGWGDRNINGWMVW